MLENAPIINLLAPFFAAFLVGMLGMWKRRAALPIAIIGLSVSLVSSIWVLVVVNFIRPVGYFLGGWNAPFGIVFYIDGLNALVVVLIQLVALMALIHGGKIIEKEIGHIRHFYYTLYLLFVVGVTGITQTADAFNLYVLIEVASLTSYALIAVGDRRSLHAGLNYLLLGSIGATFYLLGVGYLYIKTGTLNMQDLHAILVAKDLFASHTVQVALILLMVGLWIKMAFFPLHGWLPNAYTWSPVTSASLMSPLMTKVMIYVMIRVMLSIFGLENIMEIMWAKFVPFLAVIGILYGSFMALAQKNFRRMLTYIIVAEIGYMVGAAWLGSERGITAAFYHILSDSLMTLCLFLAAGSLAYRNNIRFIGDFENAFKKAPVTMAMLTIGALAMIGIPPTSGFFSKWYLVGAGVDAGNWIYVAALLIASFCNAVMFFRIFEIAVFGNKPSESDHGHGHDEPHDPTHHHEKIAKSEAPFWMLVPSITAAFSIILLGVFSQGLIGLISRTVTNLIEGGML